MEIETGYRMKLSSIAIILMLIACGRAEEIVIPQRPDRAQFESIRDTFIKVGCSQNGQGCHSVLVGDFKVGTPTDGAAEVESEFLLTKALIDLDEPQNSLLVRSALRDDPLALGHPICFEEQTCAYRRIVAWAGYEGPNDPTPDDACPKDDVIQDACFNL